MCNYQLNPSTVSLYSEKIMLKALFEHNLFVEFFCRNGFRNDNLAFSMGLPQEIEQEDEFKSITQKLLRQRYRTILDQNEHTERWQMGYENLARLAKFLDLNETEQAIMQFIFHLRAERNLHEMLDLLPKMDLNQAAIILADLLGLNRKEVRSTLGKSSKLVSYGLIDRNSRYNLDQFHEYLEWGETLDFDDFSFSPITEQALIDKATVPTSPATLQLSHYDHIVKHREMMLNYLEIATKTKKKGVNILLYGVAGTGKTELATLLAETLNLPAYTMASKDKNGDVLRGITRLENCRLAQKLLADRNSIIIFDEVEDIFASSLFGRSVAQEHKAWVNDFLEHNDIPMIWISNDANCIDNAFLRRFDIVFEMPMLPLKHKENLIRELVGDKLSQDYISHFACNGDLSPAVLQRSLNVINQLSVENPTEFAEKALELFNQTLKAQGFQKISPLAKDTLSYNLDWVKCDDNLHQISEGLKKNKRGRICCYGPAGTGKTAWANWLAKEIGRKTLVCQGSDLLDKYVGGTEQNIAQAFQRAKENDMVLIFDEVDTFLFARNHGQKSWEHSCVNEMLTQIEKFEGLLIVSTNLMDNLDPAALRRFDLKLHFDYLSPEQRQSVAIHQLEKLGLPPLNDAELARFQHFDNLTLGDFSSVARRHQFSPFEQSADWIDALDKALALKPKMDNNLSKWVL